ARAVMMRTTMVRRPGPEALPPPPGRYPLLPTNLQLLKEWLLRNPCPAWIIAALNTAAQQHRRQFRRLLDAGGGAVPYDPVLAHYVSMFGQGQHGGRVLLGPHHGSPVLDEVRQRLQDPAGGQGGQGRPRLVQQEDAGPGHKGPGQGQEPPLPCRQGRYRRPPL